MKEPGANEMAYMDKTPNCNMHEALVSYLYDEATAEEGRRVEAHLGDCSACKQEVAAFERVRGLLQQWQVDDLPVVRIETVAGESRSRSALTLLRELFLVAPLWARALGGMAAAMVVLAVIGTEVRWDSGGLHVRLDMIGRSRTAAHVNPAPEAGSQIEQVRAEVESLVNRRLAESESRQRAELKAQLVSLETELQSARSAEVARLASRIQEQRAKLKTLERDLDRREGLELTDILFSEVNTRSGARSSGGD